MVAAVIPSVETATAAPGDESGIVTITATAHGLVAGDKGKPVRVGSSTTAIWDDVSDSQFPSGLFYGVVDTNSLQVALPGASLTMSSTLLESTDFTTYGRWFYWDASAAIYKHTPPNDSVHAVAVLEVIQLSGTTATVAVRIQGA